jgi:hypothetical protein
VKQTSDVSHSTKTNGVNTGGLDIDGVASPPDIRPGKEEKGKHEG